MASKISINLDTSKENYTLVKCKENDDLTLETLIYENGLALDLTNKTISIQALKADGTYIIQSTGITKENNKMLADLIRDFSRVPGTTKIEVVLIESGKQNTTFSFYLEVVASVIKGAVTSEDKITSLEEVQAAVTEIDRINEETRILLNNAGAASKEDVNKINSSLEQIATLINGENNEDITSKLQKALNGKGHILLFSRIPKTYLISNTLTIYDDTTLEVSENITIKQANGTRKYMVINSDTTNGNKNINLIGGIWDCNDSNNLPTGGYPTGWTGHMFFFNNVKNLKYRNIKLMNAPKYCSLVVNCDGFNAENVYFNTGSDGLHFQPPLKNAYIQNIRGTTGDDMIAFTLGDYQNYMVSGVGDFENITVNGVHSENAKALIKIVGSGINNNNTFKHMNFNNLTGTVVEEGIAIINDYNGGNTTLTQTVCKSLNFSNVSIEGGSNGTVYITASIANLNFNNITIKNSVQFYCYASNELHLNINNAISDNDYTITDSFIKNFGVLTSLNVSNLKLCLGTIGKIFNQTPTGTYGNVSFNNINCYGASKASQYAIYLSNTTQMKNSIDMNNSYFQDMGTFAYFKGACKLKINNCSASNINTHFNFQASCNVRIESLNASDLNSIYFVDSTPTVSITGLCFNYTKILNQLVPQVNDILISSGSSETLKGLVFYNGTSWIKIV